MDVPKGPRQQDRLREMVMVKPRDISTGPQRALLVSSYGSGATSGRNLGTAGYSYDFVVKLFEPLFRRFGHYELAGPAADAIDAKASDLVRRGMSPVHICFRGLHDIARCSIAPNVVVPAWEFPDVPDHAFDKNPQNNWVQVSNDSTLVIVHGEFTQSAFRQSGVRAPIAVVPVPTPVEYFDLPDWDSKGDYRVDHPAVILSGDELDIPKFDVVTKAQYPGKLSITDHLRETCKIVARECYKRGVRPLLPYWVDRGLTEGIREALMERFAHPLNNRSMQPVDLSGVVYTSIFNPSDRRKNWEDMLSAFLIALGDRPDATLVLKLVGRGPYRANKILARYRGLCLPHRCRIVILTEFLSDEDMLDLANASTYYLTSTRAEGNCLPLMNFLAAGRPAVSPSHTAIADYFGTDMGFVVDSHPEPCAWPQDLRLRCRTTWHRLVWPSLVESLRESYRVAKQDRLTYRRLSENARLMSRVRHHPESVLPKLAGALDQVYGSPTVAKPRAA